MALTCKANTLLLPHRFLFVAKEHHWAHHSSQTTPILNMSSDKKWSDNLYSLFFSTAGKQLIRLNLQRYEILINATADAIYYWWWGPGNSIESTTLFTITQWHQMVFQSDHNCLAFVGPNQSWSANHVPYCSTKCANEHICLFGIFFAVSHHPLLHLQTTMMSSHCRSQVNQAETATPDHTRIVDPCHNNSVQPSKVFDLWVRPD